MARRRVWHVLLALLALFLLGTVIVLTTVSLYLKIEPSAYIAETELGPAQTNSTRIPKILHQTWKTSDLPPPWVPVSAGCRDMMPEYEYMLWTDESSREFIATHYSWFLPTFDGYRYPIQRADAIRYFILHHYGGIYLDLDIGCNKSLTPLLQFSVILPKTIPVGISNDLIFAEARHPFMEQTIHNLVTFDHSWIINYPTVMFSTGPMFLSVQYGLYNAKHKDEVRILPKSLYGKNANPGEAPHSFFTHYYGSSWHADDAGFITFLGKWGKLLMAAGLIVLLVGLVRVFLNRRKSNSQSKSHRRRLGVGRYDVLLPRITHRNGAFHFDAGSFFIPNSLTPSSASNTRPPSPTSSASSSTPDALLHTESGVPLLPYSNPESGSQSPVSETGSGTHSSQRLSRKPITETLHHATAWVRSSLSGTGRTSRPRRVSDVGTSSSSRRQHRLLFFLPTIFTPSASDSLRLHDRSGDAPMLPFLNRPSNSFLSQRQQASRDAKDGELNYLMEDVDDVALDEEVTTGPLASNARLPTSAHHSPLPSPRSTTPASQPTPASYARAPPPYDHSHHRTPTPNSAWSNAWGEWGPDGEPRSTS